MNLVSNSILDLRLWLAHDAARRVCRRALIALGLSLVLSTQLLFQESVYGYFSVGETLEGMWLYFLDILVIAVFMMCFVSWVDWKLPAAGKARNWGLVIAVPASVVLGITATTAAHYGAGPYPPESFLLSEAVRWVMAGAAITLVYETQRRYRNNQQQLHTAELRHKVLDNQMMEARIHMMEAQIEPHFLFNTLATVKRLYRKEPVDGAHMMSRLTAYLHATLPQIRYGLPTLASELELVRTYLEILKIRMGSRLDYTIDAPIQNLSLAFPAMLLITLVENAIKHGLNPSADGGCIDIKLFDLPDSVAVEVRDNGVGFQVGAGTAGSGIGIANIRSRLAALYGTHASLVLQQNEPAGVIARVEIGKQVATVIAPQAANSPWRGLAQQPG